MSLKTKSQDQDLEKNSLSNRQSTAKSEISLLTNFTNGDKSFTFEYLIKPNEPTKIKIFGERFVNNNYDKVNIIFEHQLYNLQTKFDFKKTGFHKISFVITKSIKDFSGMFCNGEFDNVLEILDESGDSSLELNTHLTDVSCLENLDVGNCENLSYMFYGCVNIKKFDFLKSWNVGNCKSFKRMFGECRFSNIDFLENWNFESCENLSEMFYSCKNLKNVNGAKNWNVKSVNNFSSMFKHCANLISVNELEKWDMKNAQNIEEMFRDCRNLVYINKLEKWVLNPNVSKGDIIAGDNRVVDPPEIFRNSCNQCICCYLF